MGSPQQPSDKQTLSTFSSAPIQSLLYMIRVTTSLENRRGRSSLLGYCYDTNQTQYNLLFVQNDSNATVRWHPCVLGSFLPSCRPHRIFLPTTTVTSSLRHSAFSTQTPSHDPAIRRYKTNDNERAPIPNQLANPMFPSASID